MKFKTAIGFSFAFLALLLSGCATTKSFRVDAISAGAASGDKSYHLIPANPKVSEKDLRFIEAAGYIERALAERGYKRVNDSEKASIVMTLDAVIGGPQSVAVSRPELVTPDFGYYQSVCVPVRNRAGRVGFVRTMIWAPDYPYPYEVQNRVDVATFYEKRLTLSAFDNNGAKDLPQLWSVVVQVRDGDGNMRPLIPMMAVAAARFVERDTKGEVTLRLGADDPEVLRLAPAGDGKK